MKLSKFALVVAVSFGCVAPGRSYGYEAPSPVTEATPPVTEAPPPLTLMPAIRDVLMQWNEEECFNLDACFVYDQCEIYYEGDKIDAIDECFRRDFQIIEAVNRALKDVTDECVAEGKVRSACFREFVAGCEGYCQKSRNGAMTRGPEAATARGGSRACSSAGALVAAVLASHIV